MFDDIELTFTIGKYEVFTDFRYEIHVCENINCSLISLASIIMNDDEIFFSINIELDIYLYVIK